VSSKIRTAVVGVGHLGKFHAQKYKALDICEFVGVCDNSKERVAQVANELNVKGFTDIRELLGKVDAVTIAASTAAHFELSKFFLENNIHVNVEKPITSTSVEARELCELARKKNLKLQVGHVERFNPALKAAKASLKSPLFIECHRLAPFKPRSLEVSVMLDLMIHDLDVILSLVNRKVTNVSAVGTPVMTKTIDIANARIEFENGAVANVTASRVSQSALRKFRVFQKDQYLSMDFGSGEVQLITKTGEFEPSSTALPIKSESWNLEKGDALLEETRSFVNSIINNTKCEVTGEDGLLALELAEKISDDIEKRLALNINSFGRSL
jgi:predicted dehydrogenase